jgi:hypothetical protein
LLDLDKFLQAKPLSALHFALQTDVGRAGWDNTDDVMPRRILDITPASAVWASRPRRNISSTTPNTFADIHVALILRVFGRSELVDIQLHSE